MFMHTMNNLFENMLDCNIKVLLDNLFIYSHTETEYFTVLEKSSSILMSVYVLL